MPQPAQRIVTTPVRLTGSVHPHQLASLLAVDALLRRREMLGRDLPSWEVTTLAGDVAVQRAVQRAVTREGDDRDEIGRSGFAERARRLEADAMTDLGRLLDALHVRADVDRWSTVSDAATRVARIAFVRLYEAGVLSLSKAVLDTCPSCQTVLDDADADTVEVDCELLQLDLPLTEGGSGGPVEENGSPGERDSSDGRSIEILTTAPELLVGVVAVAVPADAAPEESYIHLPLLDAEVPIVAVEGLAKPVLVVPAHDRWSHDLARQLNYPIYQVLDGDGIVCQQGPLQNLTRYAARVAAAEQLAAEGYITARMKSTESVKRCYRCGTVLVPLLGSHWLLSFTDLVSPVLEEVEAGRISFSPALAGVDFLKLAQQSGSWCVSQQLWSGQTIPVSSCLDCGRTVVSVEEGISCASCMGTLQPHIDVLDARFIAAVTPLAMMGWPDSPEDPESVVTTLSTGHLGLMTWAIPMTALAFRLAGALPFRQIVVNEMPSEVQEPGSLQTLEAAGIVEQAGAPTARAALIAGHLDVAQAAAGVDVMANPAIGDVDLCAYAERIEKALEELDAAGTLEMLIHASRSGVTPESKSMLEDLSRALLTE